MMSIGLHSHKRDVIPRNPVYGNQIIRCGSENRINAFSSSNSFVLVNSSVRSSASASHHHYLTVMRVSSFDKMSSLPICLVSFPADQTRRPQLIQVSVSSHLTQSASTASCAIYMKSPISTPSDPRRSIQLFIKSIRNTTTSIHIASTSSISDLKHFIYAHDGIPPCDQRLLHRGRELRDDALLSGLDVDGATITCLLRVFGGKPRTRRIPLSVLGGRPKTHKLPILWWFGFSRSYEDGRAGECRIRHVFSGIEFGGDSPDKWFSDVPLSSWEGIALHPVIQVLC